MKITLKQGLCLVLFSVAAGIASAQAQIIKPVSAVTHVELKRYLGQWHEIARKPLFFQRQCAYNISANYTLNNTGNIDVDNRCYTKDGQLKQARGEAFVQNPPANSKLKVSFLPKAIRWMPVGRGDYWVLKIDENYQTVLVGGADRQYLWLLSRSQKPNQAVVTEYLNYAKSMGYDLSDLIQTPQR